MNGWDLYEERMRIRGVTRRDTALQREQRNLRLKLPHSLSYHHAVVDDKEQDVAIINSDNLDTKMIYSLPGEDIRFGCYVEWMGQHWLVTERDYNTEVYTRAKMRQCNYLLRWIDAEHVIHEQWCITEDGTKYLTGELEDRDFIITRGDSRIAIIIGRNEETAILDRIDRFLVDDPLSSHMLAYALTKPLKLNTYTDADGSINGVLGFVLQEVNTTDDDNTELRIADYYKHFLHETDADGNPILRPTESVPSAIDMPRREKWM